MTQSTLDRPRPAMPTIGATIELLKPITWFAPMWAFGCGIVSSGAAVGDRWAYVAGGILLAGPLICGTSQAVNDWYDREVDAINEPNRVIPSGRMPGTWGFSIAVANTLLSLVVAYWLGPWVFGAAIVGLAIAWAYSAPPFRLKRSGWWGPGAVGLCYEGLPWFTAAAAALGAFPGAEIVLIALLYSVGAHGIMTLNDFKSVEGDRQTGLASLPATLGVDKAARLACLIMGVPQLFVIFFLLAWGHPIHALIVLELLIGQVFCMRRLLRDPLKFTAWYNATGTTMFVLGMLASAFAIRAMQGAAA
ncbi:MAG: chlorophyll synthase ChlG [Rhizobiaceae bacterium]|nr:chlorophyll synthase ChlG [Rhizobiaceae bacterium]